MESLGRRLAHWRQLPSGCGSFGFVVAAAERVDVWMLGLAGFSALQVMRFEMMC